MCSSLLASSQDWLWSSSRDRENSWEGSYYPCLLGNCVHIPICFQRFSFHHDSFVSGILQSTTGRVTHLQPSTTYIFSNEEASPNEQRPKPPAIDKSSTAGAGSTVIRYSLNEDLGYEFNSNTCNHWRLSTLACMARKLKSQRGGSNESFQSWRNSASLREHKSRVSTLLRSLRCFRPLTLGRPSCDAHRDANSSSSNAHPQAAPG